MKLLKGFRAHGTVPLCLPVVSPCFPNPRPHRSPDSTVWGFQLLTVPDTPWATGQDNPWSKHNCLMLLSLIPALAGEWPKLMITAKPKETAMSPLTTPHRSTFSGGGWEGFIRLFCKKAAFTYSTFMYCGIACELSHGVALRTCTNTDKKANPIFVLQNL